MSEVVRHNCLHNLKIYFKRFSALVGVQKYNKTAFAGVILPAIVRRQRLNKKR